MLDYLFIENIAVIESARIEPKAGFSALTGETGSGKSIIIDSLMAVLGEKTSRELIRTGCSKASVSASFSELNERTLKLLEENGYETEDGRLIIQRRLSSDGKTAVRINNQPSTVGFLKELSKMLVNIHGQHDSQLLLNPDNHLAFLDGFMGDGAELEEYHTAFSELKKIARELKSVSMDEDEKQRRLDLLAYQTDELQNADIKPGEAEKLKQRINELKNAEKNAEVLTECKALIRGDDLNDGAELKIGEAAQKIAKNIKTMPASDKIYEKLCSLEADISAVAEDINIQLEQLDFSEEELTQKQQRLDLINEIILKYGSEEQAVSYCKSALKEIETIRFNDKRRVELEDALEKAEQKLIDSGEKLTKKRCMAAEKLSRQIENELKFLDFNNAKFIVKREEGRYTPRGCDNIEFLISANAGETPKPLQKVASGGELSRIMLAIRSVLSIKEDAGTLIFDEIDSGISGFAASKVAEKLHQLSKKFQILCVTHLAQIAAKADSQFLITKSVENNKTFTKVTEISGEDRILEIARIISGDKITENVYNSAKEMLGEGK